MAFANLAPADGGNAVAWSPWLRPCARSSRAPWGSASGAIASRSEGIYFLMITLAFSVLVFYFFSQVDELSGFGGVNNVDCRPRRHPVRTRAAVLRDVAVAVLGVPGAARHLGAGLRPRTRRACATSRPECARSGTTSPPTA
jgi:branched-chain amino acid transport system permease protein